MAKIVEEVVVVKFSRAVKDGADYDELVTQDIEQALEQVAQELVGTSAIVEVVKA